MVIAPTCLAPAVDEGGSHQPLKVDTICPCKSKARGIAKTNILTAGLLPVELSRKMRE
jgi:hypothetical protein